MQVFAFLQYLAAHESTSGLANRLAEAYVSHSDVGSRRSRVAR
jgi:hypothetical protein